MDVLSCTYRELDDIENEILGELASLENQTQAHLESATASGHIAPGVGQVRHERIREGVSHPSLGKTDSMTSTDGIDSSRIKLGDNFYKIESFGNSLKTIANESDCVLNKLKCAVSIVECVSVLYQSASKLIKFFTEYASSDDRMDSSSKSMDSGLEDVDGRPGSSLAGLDNRIDVSLNKTNSNVENTLDSISNTKSNQLSNTINKTMDPFTKGINIEHPNDHSNQLYNQLDNGQFEKIDLSDESLDAMFEDVRRYIGQVELAKKNGYWKEVLLVISKGYIAQVIGSLKWVVLRYLSSAIVHGSGTQRSPSSSSSESSSERSKLLTRLAVCLGSEMDVFKCYLTRIRLEFPSSSGVIAGGTVQPTRSGAMAGQGTTPLVDGNEITLLTKAIQRGRNVLVNQANIVLSELGGRYYIEICREIHEYVSLEVANIFIDLIRVHFSAFITTESSSPNSMVTPGNSGYNVTRTTVGGYIDVNNNTVASIGAINTMNATSGSNGYMGTGSSSNHSSNIGSNDNSGTNNNSINSNKFSAIGIRNPLHTTPSTNGSSSNIGISVSSRGDVLSSYGATNEPSTHLLNSSSFTSSTTHFSSNISSSGGSKSNMATSYTIKNNTANATNNGSISSNIITNINTDSAISPHNGSSYTSPLNTTSSSVVKAASASHTTAAAHEALLMELETALNNQEVLETISSDVKYQKLLDTIAIMASLWSDFECALRDSARPVYAKLTSTLISPSSNAYDSSSTNIVDRTNDYNKSSMSKSSNYTKFDTNEAITHGNNTNTSSSNTSNVNGNFDGKSIIPDTITVNTNTAQETRNLATNSAQDTTLIYGKDGLVMLSLATKTLQSILNMYVQLQHVFIVKAVQQAIQISDTIYLAQDSLVSTLVDDVFFILQKSQQRSIGTGDLQTACATFNQTSGIIANELKNGLVENLMHSQSLYERWAQKLDNLANGSVQSMLEDHFKRTWGTIPETIGSKYSFVHSLNNIEECLGLLENFKQEMRECFTNQFLRGNQDKSLLIDNTIQALDLVKSELEEILDTCCTYAINMLKDHLNDPLIKFGSIDFEMDEEKYARSQNDEQFVDQLVNVLNIVLGHINTNYTPTVGVKCMSNLLEKLSKYLETCTLTKRFTVYGAVYFDNAIRSLVYTCSNYNQEIRKQFTTLLQISDVLNVNNRDDLMLLKESEYTIDISKYSSLRTDLNF